jgi:opacity protein-like surface antigen
MKSDFFGCLVHGMSTLQKTWRFTLRHKGWALLAAAMAVSLPAWAQQPTPTFEAFVGYSHLSYYPQVQGSSGRSITLNGGGGSIDWNFMKYLGLKAEFDGYTSTTKTFVIPAGSSFLPAGGTLRAQVNMVTYLFGPQAKARFGVAEPFGHILFGGAHSNFYGDLFHAAGVTNRRPDNTAFAMAVGGGLDFRVHKLLSVRPIEVDYLMTRFGNASVINNQNNFRYQAGVVFNFGNH